MNDIREEDEKGYLSMLEPPDYNHFTSPVQNYYKRNPELNPTSTT